MNEQFKEQITAKAREFATSYTNRHFPNQPAFAFGNEGWAKFVDALVELAGAHPDKGTSALAAPVVPAPGARDGAHSDQVALLLSKVSVAACVIENLPELPGYNGSVLTIDNTEAARISKELYEIAEFLDKPQAAPVAQLSEPPEGWKLVPIEPTPKMVDATFNHPQECDGLPESHNTRNKRIWCAMLAAAHYPKGSIVKPYAYRRWRICYVVARACGYAAHLAALLAFVAMSKIEIRIKE